MKISKTVLQQIIHEEAERLFKLEKLQETKRVVDENIRLISEGKKKMSDEELEELFAGLKSVLGAGAKAVGQAVSSGAEKIQQFGQKVADTYKQGENQAKIEKLKKQQVDLANQITKVNSELLALLPPDEAKKASGAKPASTKSVTPKASAPKTTTAKATAGKKPAATKTKTAKQSASPYSVTE